MGWLSQGWASRTPMASQTSKPIHNDKVELISIVLFCVRPICNKRKFCFLYSNFTKILCSPYTQDLKTERIFSLIAVKLGLSQLPEDVQWKHIVGAGFLRGIGFTMSIFITLLAFDNPEIVQSSKISILLSSFLAGTVGYLILNRQPASISNRSD